MTPTDTPTSLPCIAVGADAGGTKLALAFHDGQKTWYDQQPSVNLRTDTADGFAARLTDTIHASLDKTEMSRDMTVCVGAAGAGTDTVAAACRKALAEALDIPTNQIVVTSDARVALEAAFPAESGILIIAGTGSGCYGLDENGRLLRAGGWGPGLEDPGSGSDLGRAAVKHLLARLESGSADRFSTMIAEALGLDQPTIPRVLDLYYGQGFHPASLAPAILDGFEAGDPAALELIGEQCDALARQCARLISSMDRTPLPRIAVTGGLAARDSYIDALSSALKRHYPSVSAARIGRPPVDGALSWALRLKN